MENTDSLFDIKISVQNDFLLIFAGGNYSLLKAKNLFKLAIDNALLHNKSKILIDVTDVVGNISFIDRFEYSEFLAKYRAEHALTKVNRIAVVGQEPIVHKNKFGETIAVNRGTDVRVFTDMGKASIWLNKK
jgi:hypothetical protein